MLKDIIADYCDYFNVTTDIWTSRSLDALISLMLHFVDLNSELHTYLLEVKLFNKQHTGVNIARQLGDMFNDWGLDKDWLTLLLCDNASNGSLATSLMGVSSYGC